MWNRQPFEKAMLRKPLPSTNGTTAIAAATVTYITATANTATVYANITNVTVITTTVTVSAAR